MRAVSLIEPLEDRIAPAAVTIAPNGKSASYKDSAGDTILVTTSKGAFTASQFNFDSSNAGQLTELSLTGNKGFNGANIAFSITPVAGGSATVNIGYIDAVNLSLASVTVPGDLARIDAGGGASSMALGKLTVNTLGANPGTQNGLSYSTESNITGTIGTVNIAGNLDGALNAMDFNSKPGTGNIQHLNIGGSLDGNNSSGAGVVLFTGTLGNVVIGGGIEGGSSQEFGSIVGSLGTLSKIGSVVIKGSVPDDPNPKPLPNLVGTSILGGSAALTGGISAAYINKVSIAGDIYGSSGVASGFVEAGVNLGSVTVGGSLIGGNFVSGNSSETAGSAGLIYAGTTIGNVTIGKSIFGGSGVQSGEILSPGTIQKVTVMGDVVGGSAGNSSASGLAGAIRGHVVGSVVVDGSLTGGNLVSGDGSQLATFGGIIASDTSMASLYIGKTVTGGTGADSGYITANSGAIKTLTIGKLDTTAGAGSADSSLLGGSGADSGQIKVVGDLGTLVLTHGVAGGSGGSSGIITVNGAITSATIGGNLAGAGGASSGTLTATGLIKSVSIAGGLVGGAGESSGDINADVGATSIAISGNIKGGSGQNTGLVSVDGALAKLAVGASIVGGSGTNSGLVSVNGALTTLTIGGGLQGGTADNTGTITAIGLLKTGKITDGVTGSNNSGSTILTNTGYIQAGGIGSLVVGGALTAGENTGSGKLDTSGAIRSTAAINSITIGGLVGNSTNPAIVSAVGQANTAANAKTDVAIGAITIKAAANTSNVAANYGDILAGYSTDTQNSTRLLGTGVNADAQIGTVTIDGNLIATNIVAGIAQGSSGFGDPGSTLLSGSGVTDLPSIISTISKIVVTGSVAAPAAATSETFGIAAQYVASASVDGAAVKLVAGPDNDTFPHADHPLGGSTTGVVLYEV